MRTAEVATAVKGRAAREVELADAGAAVRMAAQLVDEVVPAAVDTMERR